MGEKKQNKTRLPFSTVDNYDFQRIVWQFLCAMVLLLLDTYILDTYNTPWRHMCNLDKAFTVHKSITHKVPYLRMDSQKSHTTQCCLTVTGNDAHQAGEITPTGSPCRTCTRTQVWPLEPKSQGWRGEHPCSPHAVHIDTAPLNSLCCACHTGSLCSLLAGHPGKSVNSRLSRLSVKKQCEWWPPK